jgi:hypothetical protein
MRFRTKAAIMAAFAGPAIAGLILTGAGPANAAVTATTAQTSSTWMPVFPYCSPYNLERWDFRGNNTVNLTFDGNSSFTYSVHFYQRGSCLSGWLKDTYIPNNYNEYLPIHGTVFQNHVTFSVAYTYPGSDQGTRTFDGYIDWSGKVSGKWSETGTEGGSGTWSLENAVRPACPWWYPWYGFMHYGNGCPVPFPYWWFY